MKKEDKETTLEIRFSNNVSAKHFAHWLCESGEQQYWEWMQCREEEEDGDITAIHFDYHNEDKTKDQSDPKRYHGFVSDNIIRTECGRKDKRNK